MRRGRLGRERMGIRKVRESVAERRKIGKRVAWENEEEGVGWTQRMRPRTGERFRFGRENEGGMEEELYSGREGEKWYRTTIRKRSRCLSISMQLLEGQLSVCK